MLFAFAFYSREFPAYVTGICTVADPYSAIRPYSAIIIYSGQEHLLKTLLMIFKRTIFITFFYHVYSSLLHLNVYLLSWLVVVIITCTTDKTMGC